MRQDSPKINSIDKALNILEAFVPYNREMGTIEISRKLGFHKATVSRILQNLTRHGFLSQNSENKKFVLGPSVMDLARALNQSIKTNMVQLAKPFIDDLRDTLKETVILEVLSGGSTFMAYIAEGPRLVRLAGSIGDRVPIHAAAGGKAILAFSPADRRKALLNGKLHRFTDKTITSRRILYKLLKEIKRQGVAFDHDEIDEGTSAASAPIFNYEGLPVGAVVVAGPSQRISKKTGSRMISELRHTAAKISAQLHYQKGDD